MSRDRREDAGPIEAGDDFGLPRRSEAEGTPVAAEHVAAELFTHGVISHLVCGGAAMDERIASALARIDRPLSRRPLLRAVAIVLLALGLWVLFPSRGEATLLDRVRQLVAAAERDVDRHYALEIDPDRGRVLQGTMTVRGGERFVVTLDLPRGEVRFGFDGTFSWMVPPLPRAPVLVGRGLPGPLREKVSGGPVRMPFLNLARLLSRLEHDYELSGQRTGAPGSSRFMISGDRRRDPGPRSPSRVEAILDTRTGTLLEIDLEWPEERPPAVPRTIRLELLDESDRTPDHYSHEAHHDPDRRVIRSR